MICKEGVRRNYLAQDIVVIHLCLLFSAQGRALSVQGRYAINIGRFS
jgi:hypothetical protein